MNYKESFRSFVKECLKSNHYVGIGNPNAKILLIGKEAYINDNIRLDDHANINNAKEWDNHINDNTCQELEYSVDQSESEYLKKTWGRNTWSKYQRLIGSNEKKRYVDFLKDAFTTEMNETASKTTRLANKDSIPQRLRLFKESSFIQEFPIIVLACSNYIKNDDNNREIDDTFQVTFDENGKHHYDACNWFFTHHSADGKRLVIHTRQLSNSVKPELLEDMRKEINVHLDKIKVL